MFVAIVVEGGIGSEVDSDTVLASEVLAVEIYPEDKTASEAVGWKVLFDVSVSAAAAAAVVHTKSTHRAFPTKHPKNKRKL